MFIEKKNPKKSRFSSKCRVGEMMPPQPASLHGRFDITEAENQFM